jgi:hypothetical protein
LKLKDFDCALTLDEFVNMANKPEMKPLLDAINKMTKNENVKIGKLSVVLNKEGNTEIRIPLRFSLPKEI